MAMSVLAESLRPVKMDLGPKVSGAEIWPTPTWEVTEEPESSLLIARLKPSRTYDRIAFQCLMTAVLVGEAGNIWLPADAASQQIIGLVLFMLMWVPGVQAQLDIWKLAGAIYDRLWGDGARQVTAGWRDAVCKGFSRRRRGWSVGLQ